MSEILPSDVRPTRISVVSTLAPGDVERLYAMYQVAFAPVLTRAAGRHMLTFDEFAGEAVDGRIDKYLAYKGDEIVGITALATDVRAVPWIEPESFLSRYRDAADRGALFYLMFTMVDPRADGFRVFKDMMYAVCGRFAAQRGVVGMDFSEHNAKGAVGRIIRAMPRLFGSPVEQIDVQSYVVMEFAGGSDEVAPEVVDRQFFYIGDFRNIADRDRPAAAKILPRQAGAATCEAARGGG